MVLQRVITLANATDGQPLPEFSTTLSVPTPIQASDHWGLQYNLLSKSVWYQLVFFIENQNDELKGYISGSVGGCTATVVQFATLWLVEPIVGAMESEGDNVGVLSTDFMNGLYTIDFSYDGISSFTLAINDSTGKQVWTVTDTFSDPPSILDIEAVGFDEGKTVTFTEGEIDTAFTGDNLQIITQQGMTPFGMYEGSTLYWANETGESSNFYQYIKSNTPPTFTIASIIVPTGTTPPIDAQPFVLADSVAFNTAAATWGLNGTTKGLTIPVTNSWTASQSLVIYGTFKSFPSIYVVDGSAQIDTGQTASVFCIPIIPIPAGTYSVEFAAITITNQAVSSPTTPVTIVVT
jgi:hypothetical protein